MADYYADSSVLVKRHLHEAGTRWMQQLCAAIPGHSIISSELCGMEVVAAFNRRVREGSLASAAYPIIRNDFLAVIQQDYDIMPLTTMLASHVRTLLERHPLRTYDAIHLASALQANDQLIAAALPPLTFLAADGRLLAAAQAEGLATDNPALYM
jgi:predicted nucleic acid-binding protein